MISYSCMNYDGDEDCHKCCKHGYIYSCDDCEDYEGFFTSKRKAQNAAKSDESEK